ncbi:GNAT family N-acetyltransferase [Microbaculum marinum]|uniref:GNAT family N-acetyltransferase n=1 Tax=Microbaculum marinum TaxID=1764581 RepID=A0AAW9RM27_9HYPH
MNGNKTEVAQVQPVFRRARAADVAAIVAMLADDPLGSRREDLSEPVAACYRAAFEAIDADPNQLLAVAEVGEATVGCLQLSFIPGLSRKGMWRGQIESVRISSSARGSGLGRLMIGWAIEECRRRDCGLVQLTTDKSRTDARRFYESLGFSASHEGMKLAL